MDDHLHSQQQQLLDADAALQPFLDAALEIGSSAAAATTAGTAAAVASTARALVVKVLSHPEVVCGYDQIKQALGGALGTGTSAGTPDGDKVLRTLELFSYGTVHEYRSAPPGTYLPLSEAQVRKLRQLSVLTLVQQACRRRQTLVPYEHVRQALQLDEDPTASTGGRNNNETVEEVLISCIYGGIMRGQLCQKTEQLLLQAQMGPPVLSRDVPPPGADAMMTTTTPTIKMVSVPELLEAVRRLHGALEGAKQNLRSDQDRVRSQLEASHRAAKKQHERIEKAKDLAVGRVPQSAATRGGGSKEIDPESAAAASAASQVAAAAVATGQDPSSFAADASASTGGSRRQKRSRGGIGGRAESVFGGGRFHL